MPRTVEQIAREAGDVYASVFASNWNSEDCYDTADAIEAAEQEASNVLRENGLISDRT